jgi:hypothetical protein
MNLDTYESTAVSGMFVTLPSAEANATISIVDELSVLQLNPFRCSYRFADESQALPFVEFVLTEIAVRGFALHRFDPSLHDRPATRARFSAL